MDDIAQFQSLLANQRKTTDLVDDKQEVAKHFVQTDTADHIFLHRFHVSGAAFSLSVRAADPVLRWNIYGTKGQIDISSFSPTLNLSFGRNTVRVNDADGNVTEQVVEKRPRDNIEGVYEAFAVGDARLASFASALERHRDGRKDFPF
ncbi:hypothetical protein FN846DRAFT_904329 [Sphaerosporella brunnea]|uniref:Uncharacterized protein n=1 Tax=Sphaerosporella brunnea TaxID=1250544 RepID=A0A5J5F4X6_9PEZI|nr:hypothetical protein FN846DRAFT_904329 [Sphaerosporella brunnea]